MYRQIALSTRTHELADQLRRTRIRDVVNLKTAEAAHEQRIAAEGELRVCKEIVTHSSLDTWCRNTSRPWSVRHQCHISCGLACIAAPFAQSHTRALCLILRERVTSNCKRERSREQAV